MGRKYIKSLVDSKLVAVRVVAILLAAEGIGLCRRGGTLKRHYLCKAVSLLSPAVHAN